MYHISGIQQIGIGVYDVREAWEWYRRSLGFDILMFDDTGTAKNMLRYTGGKPQDRRAILAVNLQGGGGLELWQYITRKPQPPAFVVQAGDLGINIMKIKSVDVKGAYAALLNKKADIAAGIVRDPAGCECFHLKDLYGNLLQVTGSNTVFYNTGTPNGGVYGAFVGVTDMEKSAGFYGDILGYDKVIYDAKGQFEDLTGLPGGSGRFRRVLLAHSRPRKGPFSTILGESRLELLQALDRAPERIYADRFWGDPGFIQICFDIRGMRDLKMRCEQAGAPFTADSNPEAYSSDGKTFAMGEALGHFTYIEDPDGTLIEFVETHKIPVIKKLGWYLDLKERSSEKPLPVWMLKTLRWNRVKG